MKPMLEVKLDTFLRTKNCTQNITTLQLLVDGMENNTSDFIWGYVSPNIIIFDTNTGTKKGIIKFQTQDFKSMRQQQPNKIIYNNSITNMKFIIA